MNRSCNQQITDQDVFKAFDMNLAIIRFEVNHRITYVNNNFARAVGYTEDEMITMKHEDLCFQEFVESKNYNIFWRELLKGESQHGKIKRKDKNGNKVWLEATYMPIFSADQRRVISISKVAFNIT